MVSFTCNHCQDVVKKPKIKVHASQICGGQSYNCVDCMQTFDLSTIQNHTSCISETDKYQGKWKDKKGGDGKRGRENGGADDEHKKKVREEEDKRRAETVRHMPEGVKIGSDKEILDACEEILKANGRCMSTKKLSQQLVTEYFHGRLAKAMKHVVHEAVASAKHSEIVCDEDGDILLKHRK